MANIQSIRTRLPSHHYTREDILGASSRWLAGPPQQRELFDRFVTSSQVSSRHFAIPLETILALNGAQERATHFRKEGRALLAAVVQDLLDDRQISADSIDHLIFTSCSSPAIPSIDTLLVDDLSFHRSVNRIPIYQHGCAGGIIGLAMASRLVKPGQRALLSSVELCSLLYQAGDLSGGNLVGSAIFGDGAAAVLVEGSEEGLVFVEARSHLVPESAHLMGYDIENDGTHLRLDRSLPQMLAREAPPFVRQFLSDQGRSSSDIDWWLFHPGGAKILSALETAFKIEKDRSRWAWEVLEEYGNMSSASILFVLESFCRSKVVQKGEQVCMLGVGPGLTIEAILLEQR